MSVREPSNTPSKIPLKGFTLPKTRILRGKRKFEEIFSNSGFITTSNLTFRFVTRPFSPDDPFKIGFIAPKRIGKAVDRNRCKRFLREAFRLSQYAFADILEKHHLSIDGVFMARRTGFDTTQAEKEMATIYKKLRNHLLAKQNY